MQGGVSPELVSGQRRVAPGRAWLEPGVFQLAGWRKVEDQLSPDRLSSWSSLWGKEEKQYKCNFISCFTPHLLTFPLCGFVTLSAARHAEQGRQISKQTFLK